ncbi:MAG: HAMP domain-containing histidine kinase [Planctomyces sp.]|nr:HAMP domain-containing histidine kinase [Planctomyces sp.]
MTVSYLTLPAAIANRCLELLLAADIPAAEHPPERSSEQISEVERLITEIWVRQSRCVSATLLRIETPNRVRVSSVRLDSENRLTHEVRLVSEPCTVILDGQALLRLAAENPEDGLQSIHQWPRHLAALVLQHPPVPGTVEGESDRVLAADLMQLTQTFLGKFNGAANMILPPSDKLQAMAEFAAGAGHEINNPLASIVGQTQMLLRSETSIDRQQALETIGTQAWRIRDMIGNTMLFARPPKPKFEVFDFIRMAQEVTQQLTEDLASSEIVVTFHSEETRLLIQADITQLQALIGHLVRNGVEAIRGRKGPGRVTVSAAPTIHGDALQLIVEDTAGAINDDSVRTHLFDPFFSGRQAGRGLGFGLCLAWQIVNSHRGFIFCYAPQSTATAFHIGLPLEQPVSP